MSSCGSSISIPGFQIYPESTIIPRQVVSESMSVDSLHGKMEDIKAALTELKTTMTCMNDTQEKALKAQESTSNTVKYCNKLNKTIENLMDTQKRTNKVLTKLTKKIDEMVSKNSTASK